jgi:2-polyprenyl-6-methoxyphenol hydroxylase-like FAD-dependent oxidoreductase
LDEERPTHDCLGNQFRDDTPVRRLSIGIVGCGVGGCTAALLLARQGHAITLFEQTPRVGPAGAGVLLQASGQRVLHSLNLLDSVLSNAERIEELVATTHRGQHLSRLRFADRPGGHIAYGLHRGDLFAVLHTAVLAAAVDLRLNHTITGIKPDGRTLMDTAGNSVGTFDLIIAADGSRSRLRQSCRLRAFIHAYQPAALWAVGKHPAVRGQLIQRTHHTQKLCGLLPMGGGRTSFFWGVRILDWPKLRAGSFTAWQQEVTDLMPAAEPLVRSFNSFDDLVFSTYLAVWMPRVVRGNVAFLGDAAHASSPLLGHGINLAMVDARDLSNALSSESSIADALNRYDAAQRLRNGYYSAASALLTPSFQGRSTLLGIARDFVLPRLQRIMPARRIMLRTLAGV